MACGQASMSGTGGAVQVSVWGNCWDRGHSTRAHSQVAGWLVREEELVLCIGHVEVQAQVKPRTRARDKTRKPYLETTLMLGVTACERTVGKASGPLRTQAGGWVGLGQTSVRTS